MMSVIKCALVCVDVLPIIYVLYTHPHINISYTLVTDSHAHINITQHMHMHSYHHLTIHTMYV